MPDSHSPILIKKASGHTEAFDVNKLRASLNNAGARDEAIDEVVAEIESWSMMGSAPPRSTPAPSESSGR